MWIFVFAVLVAIYFFGAIVLGRLLRRRSMELDYIELERELSVDKALRKSLS